MDEAITTAARIIKEADGLLIGAGAGMGVDSGLPDFRGDEGFWKVYPALAKGRIPFIKIADPIYFLENPRLAWGLHGHMLQLFRAAEPHKGFYLLQEFATKMKHGSFVFTSNIDGQFQKAGFTPERILECHGSIHNLQCTTPCSRAIWSADKLQVIVNQAKCRCESELPVCPFCGETARPNVLMFNDWGWIEDLTDIQSNRFYKWKQATRHRVVIEIGAGLGIPTVRRFCESIAAPLIRINPAEPEIPTENRKKEHTAVSLKMGGLEALEKIHAAWLVL